MTLFRRHLGLAALAVLAACAAPAESRSQASIDLQPLLAQGLPDLKGETHDLAAPGRDGKGLVLVFWQPWCQTCIGEIPRVEQAAKAHGDSHSFFGVVSGPDESVDALRLREIVTDEELTYAQLRDRGLGLTRALAIQSTPTVVMVDADGRVTYRSSHLPAEWR